MKARLKQLYIFIALLTVCMHVSLAAPNTLTLSYMVHPQIGKYKKLIKESYQEANIAIQLLPLPTARGIIAVENNIVDGDIARTVEVINRMNNLIKVGPPLTSVTIHLICIKNVKCNEQTIKDNTIKIVTSSAVVKNLPPSIKSNIHAKFYFMERPESYKGMLSPSRFHYAILTSEAIELPKSWHKEYQSYPIYSSVVYHVLHKKHLQTAQKVAPIIRRRLSRIIENQPTKQFIYSK